MKQKREELTSVKRRVKIWEFGQKQGVKLGQTLEKANMKGKIEVQKARTLWMMNRYESNYEKCIFRLLLMSGHVKTSSIIAGSKILYRLPILPIILANYLVLKLIKYWFLLQSTLIAKTLGNKFCVDSPKWEWGQITNKHIAPIIDVERLASVAGHE